MSRVERRMYRRMRGQVLLRRCLWTLTALMVAVGLWQRGRSAGGMTAQPVLPPTPTPITAAFDETVTARTLELPQTVWYAIQTGIFADASAAEAKAALYAHRGAPGYVNRDGEKHRVYIACYGDREAASAVRERLSSQQDVETYLHEWRCEALTLRLSGMAGQLDVAEAGLMLPLQAAGQLRDAAELLDSGEMSTAEALDAVEAVNAQWVTWTDTARSRFTRPYPALIGQLMSLGERWQSHRDALRKAGAEGPTEASAALKVQAMAMFDEAVALRDNLKSE